MITSNHCVELIGNASFVERLVQSNSLRVGNQFIVVAVNGDNRWNRFSDHIDRRDAPGNFISVGLIADPYHGIALRVRSVDFIEHVRDSEPVHDGSDFGIVRRVARPLPHGVVVGTALTIETSGGSEHSGGKGEMASGGAS